MHSDWPSATVLSEKRFALLSHGVDDSLLRAILQAGSKVKVDSFQPTLEEFDPCVSHLVSCGYKGFAVMNPHKVSAARLAIDFFRVRNSAGLANALSSEEGIYGRNTEVMALEKILSELPPKKALVLGAGQAARSVLTALLENGWEARIWNRNAAKSRLLQATFNRYGMLELIPHPTPTGCSLVVNATPLGVKLGEQVPLEWTQLQPKTTVFDLVYRNVATEFIRSAKMRGLPVIDGRELLVESAALSLEWWLGEVVDRAPMLAAARIPKLPETIR